jgi:carboxypeptidase C (cathepsin A)
MSQSLNFDLVVDHASGNPGSDLPYVLGLPSYTATAFYHHKLPNIGKATLPTLLAEVETWATGVYLPALAEGADLDPAKRAAVIAKLHDYTGLSSDYIDRADLRIEAGEFLQQLGSPSGEVYGRLDTRYEGPRMDPLEKEPSYDPQTARLAAAYAAGWDNYARNDLKLKPATTFIQQVGDAWSVWNWKHVQPNVNEPVPGALNTMADLAAAMTFNPGLKVMLNSGYFDVATPFFQGSYELKHLPMSADLQKNITMFRYPSGHKIFVDPASLDALHKNLSHFIEVAAMGGRP